MTFPEFLRAEVLRLGDGVSSRGEPLAAIVLGLSPRTIRNWLYETGAAPSKVEQAGARILLPHAGALSLRDGGIKRKMIDPAKGFRVPGEGSKKIAREIQLLRRALENLMEAEEASTHKFGAAEIDRIEKAMHEARLMCECR